MAVSQKQIAEKLGVSIALVSRVLSGRAREIGIAPDTIDRVLKAAGEMGYVPSAAALSLKGKATRTIGVAVYDFNDPFFGTLIQQIQAKAHEFNYSLILAGFLNRIPDEQDLQALYKHAIDGLIVIGTESDARWLESFHHMPIARIGHGGECEQSVRISTDEESAARLLINHLVETGRKNPVYTCANLPAHRLRSEVFVEVAADCGIALAVEQSSERNAFAAGEDAARQMIQAGTTADAFICATDQVAMGALHALVDAEIDVPGQMAVTGFDDIPAAKQFIPSLTTIHQPLATMVQQAFEAVMGPPPPQILLVQGELVARKTT
ncbi:MAG: LacI family DNA-binding transcriptional regulator [Verrucomicrobiota bacterium]